MIGKFPAVCNFHQLFLKSTGSFVTNHRFSPIVARDWVVRPTLNSSRLADYYTCVPSPPDISK